MSLITYGLDPQNSHPVVYGMNEYIIEVIVVDYQRSSPHPSGGSFPFGSPFSKTYRGRDIIIKIRREDEDDWKIHFLENVDENMIGLEAKIIDITGDGPHPKKIAFHIKERIERGEINFKFSMKEVLVEGEKD